MGSYRDRRTEQVWREEIVRVCRLLHQKGYVVATDGNVSVRLSENRVLSTPSGFSKGFLAPEQLVMTDLEGRKVLHYEPASSHLKPTSELLVHLEAYRQRSDLHSDDDLAGYLEEARQMIAEMAVRDLPEPLGMPLVTEDFEHLRWFPLPSEIWDELHGREVEPPGASVLHP